MRTGLRMGHARRLIAESENDARVVYAAAQWPGQGVGERHLRSLLTGD